MKNNIALLVLALAALLIVEACKKDNPEPAPVNNPSLPEGDIFGSERTVKVMGTVADEAGNPLSGAEVRVGALSTQTNSGGVFILENAPVLENLGYVTVSMPGYFPGSRSFVPAQEGNTVNIRMLAKTDIGSVNGASGGSLQSEGVSLVFEANSFSRNGSPYAGTVNVAMNYIDPTGAHFSEEMPGNLLAVTEGSASGLTSYGMIGVELSDDMGGEVELSEGSTAGVRFPVPAGLLNTAPAVIDLWSFDEVNGYWISEGQALLEGNEYVAEVSHFSFWNLDIPWDAVILSGRVLDPSGNPIHGAKVIISSNSSGSAYDYSGADGSFGGYVPGNESFTITIQTPCDGGLQTVYSATVGPFAANTDLGDFVVLNFQNTTMVVGTVVDCDNNPIINGYVASGSGTHFVQNGQFSFLACGDNVTIVPHTLLDAGQAQTFSLNGEQIDVGALIFCSDIEAGTVTDIDGNVYQTVVIGTQEWMAENLRTSTYANGEEIPNVIDNEEWTDLTSGAWCYYNNNIQFENPYGKLYTWYAVNDQRNICPTGWHIPSDAEWTVLTDNLGGEIVAGGKMKSAGMLFWIAPNEGATNESGFSGLPGGYRKWNAQFLDIAEGGYWWSSTSYATDYAWVRYLSHSTSEVEEFGSNMKRSGNSVRCLKD